MSHYHDLLKGDDRPSAIEKLLKEFEMHESKEEKSLEPYCSTLGEIAC